MPTLIGSLHIQPRRASAPSPRRTGLLWPTLLPLPLPQKPYPLGRTIVTLSPLALSAPLMSSPLPLLSASFAMARSSHDSGSETDPMDLDDLVKEDAGSGSDVSDDEKVLLCNAI